jgi:hypothetical protein
MDRPGSGQQEDHMRPPAHLVSHQTSRERWAGIRALPDRSAEEQQARILGCIRDVTILLPPFLAVPSCPDVVAGLEDGSLLLVGDIFVSPSLFFLRQSKVVPAGSILVRLARASRQRQPYHAAPHPRVPAGRRVTGSAWDSRRAPPRPEPIVLGD